MKDVIKRLIKVREFIGLTGKSIVTVEDDSIRIVLAK